MAQKGQIQSQITDSYLKQMLEGISEGGVRPRARALANPEAAAARRAISHASARVAPSRRQTESTGAKVQFDRRRMNDDSDSDIDLDGL